MSIGEDGIATLRAVRDSSGAYIRPGEHGDLETAPIDSLVVISEFGEPVLPGLRPVGSIELGGDKPNHVVIKGENHHALEALRFTHAGKVDCIYIDPPYNSGARDWKYNNDYVDENDAYRHSKWLAFIERRLKLAKDLIKPDGVLVVTIDEREVYRLGVLLEQLFPGTRIQMAVIVINANGVDRGGLARVDEEAFFVRFGNAASPVGSGDDLLTGEGKTRDIPATVRWERLLRGGMSGLRGARGGANMFYAVLIDAATKRVIGAGPPIPEGNPAIDARVGGFEAAWPIKTDGRFGQWRIGPERLRALASQGFVRLGNYDEQRRTWTVYYVGDDTRDKIKQGVIAVVGHEDNGVARLAYAGVPRVAIKTVWNRKRHAAGVYGSALLADLLGQAHLFPYPKSLYAVEDTIRMLTVDQPEAVVLDFFAGSGTTAHAVMRLNRQDGGRRQSIMVTNNEVSVEEAAGLRRRGLRPGDPEWEAQGIFEHITRPRVTAAVTGKTPAGEPIKGDYKFTDEFPMAEGFEENVQFLELDLSRRGPS